jgi:hypothetical protein
MQWLWRLMNVLWGFSSFRKTHAIRHENDFFYWRAKNEEHVMPMNVQSDFRTVQDSTRESSSTKNTKSRVFAKTTLSTHVRASRLSRSTETSMFFDWLGYTHRITVSVPKPIKKHKSLHGSRKCWRPWAVDLDNLWWVCGMCAISTTRTYTYI